jgi:integrase
MDAMALTKHGDTLYRWNNATKDEAFNSIRRLPLLETRAEHLLHAMSEGTVSTNVFLRRMHNFAVDMSWVAWPVIPKRQWPAIQFREKRAITASEHERIISSECNAERRAFYELCWHLGGAQSDIANLQAEDIDWDAHTIGFFRKKTKSVSLIHLDSIVEKILLELPSTGPLFPKFRKLNTGHRATEFTRSCRRANVDGVTLHSYRYSWAERAKTCGYPERFAQQALGHNSKAVHRSYAKKALVSLPSLVTYEREFAEKVVKLKKNAA